MKTAIRKNERVLNLLAYLLGAGGVVGLGEIRERVEGYNDAGTGERTTSRRFERDKETLRALGVNVAYQWDPTTGERGYFISRGEGQGGQITLSRQEVELVMTLAVFSRGREGPLVDALASACQKLLALSTLHHIDHTSYKHRALLLDETAGDEALQANLEELATASEEGRRVSFVYYSIKRDRTGERSVEPYGLQFQRGQWYLVGRCMGAGEVRVFRLDRIRGKMRIEERGEGRKFDAPRDFRMGDYVGRSPWQLSRREPVEVRVSFDETGAWLVEEAQPAGLKLAKAKGSAEARMEVSNESGFFKWVLSFGVHAKILGPQEVVEEFKRFVQKVEGSWQV